MLSHLRMEERLPSAAAAHKPKLLAAARDVLRRKCYSIRTEQAYLDWIKRSLVPKLRLGNALVLEAPASSVAGARRSGSCADKGIPKPELGNEDAELL